MTVYRISQKACNALTLKFAIISYLTYKNSLLSRYYPRPPHFRQNAAPRKSVKTNRRGTRHIGTILFTGFSGSASCNNRPRRADCRCRDFRSGRACPSSAQDRKRPGRSGCSPDRSAASGAHRYRRSLRMGSRAAWGIPPGSFRSRTGTPRCRNRPARKTGRRRARAPRDRTFSQAR